MKANSVLALLSFAMVAGGDKKKKRKNEENDVFSFQMPPSPSGKEVDELNKSKDTITNATSSIARKEEELNDLRGNGLLVNDIVDMAAEKVVGESGHSESTILIKTDFFNVFENIIGLTKSDDFSIRLNESSPKLNPNAQHDIVMSPFVEGLTVEKVNRTNRVVFMINDKKRTHFYIAMFVKETGTVTIFDSLPSNNCENYELTVRLISMSLLAMNFRAARFVFGACHKQPDYSSCGVYAVKHLECTMKDEPIPVNGFNIKEYRMKINEWVAPMYEEIISLERRRLNDARSIISGITSTRSPDAKTEKKKRRTDLTSDIVSDNVRTDTIHSLFNKKMDLDVSFMNNSMAENEQAMDSDAVKPVLKFDPTLVKPEPVDPEEDLPPVANDPLSSDFIDMCNEEDNWETYFNDQKREESMEEESALMTINLSSWLTLNGTRWLNDEVIDAFMCGTFRHHRRFMSDALLRKLNWTKRTVLPVLSNFYTRTREGRILSHECVYDYDFVVFPYMTSNHWKLCIFDVASDKAIILDSLFWKLTATERKQLCKVWNDLRDEEDIKGRPELTFQVNPPGSVLKQKDSFNCGIYVCIHAFHFLGGWELPKEIDLAYQRSMIMNQILDSSHVDVKDEDGRILRNREMRKIRDEDKPVAEKWFENYVEERKKAGNSVESEMIIEPEINDVDDIEMIDVSVQSKIRVKTEKIEQHSAKVDSKPISATPTKRTVKEDGTITGSVSKMWMKPELIDEFFEKQIAKESGCFVFPVSAWTFDGIVDKAEKSMISLNMMNRLIIPFMSDHNGTYALMIIDKNKTTRKWKGLLFDPRNDQFSKEIKKEAKQMLEKYGIKGATHSMAPKNINITDLPHDYSGIIVCSRLVGVLNGKYEKDHEDMKKIVENVLDHSTIPWLQNPESSQPAGTDISLDSNQTLRRIAKNQSQQRSRASTGREKEYENDRKQYAKTKLGKGRVYVREKAAYHSKPLSAPFKFDEFILCSYCNAKKFPKEPPSYCCKEGSVMIPDELMTTPECMKTVREYLISPVGKTAMGAIRQINTFLAFVGSSSNFLSVKDLPAGGPVPVILQGEYLNGVCNLGAQTDGQMKFAQLSFCSESTALTNFIDYFGGKQKKIASSVEKVFIALRNIILENNPFARAYQAMHEMLKELIQKCENEDRELPRVMMSLKEKRELDQSMHHLANGSHSGTTTKPILDNQVFAIYTTDDGQLDYEAIARGTFVFPRHSIHRKCLNIVPWSANFHSLKFPFLFLGEQPFNMGLQRINSKGKLKTDDKNLSAREISIALLRHFGKIENHRVLGFGKLTQEFVISLEARDEFDKLSYMRKIQLDRAMQKGTTVSAHREYVESELAKQGIKLGTYVTMKNTYLGGRAHKDKCYHDSMAINRRFGHSHLFVTFTGSTNWEPIVDNLAPNNTPFDDPMLIVRTFDVVLKELKKDLFERQVLGAVKAWVLSKEFQKRGMPHAHILITLENGLTEDLIDELISAEFLNESDPSFQSKTDEEKDKLRRVDKIVKSNMVHGPCEGDDGTRFGCRIGLKDAPQCAKGYPKKFLEETTLENGKFANYKRSKNGCGVVFGGGKSTRRATNQHVVPHNRWLLSKYGCHINVEVVASVESQRYIHKYFFKGFDQCLAEIKTLISQNGDLSKVPGMRKDKGQWVYDYDETKMYMMCRVKSAPEACFRLLSMDPAEMSHVVSVLSVHLPDEQRFIFSEEDDEETIEEKAARAKSKFMMYMEACKGNLMVDVDGKEVSVRELTFAEADERLRVDKKGNKYVPYKYKLRKVTRLNPVSPRRTELYALYVMVLSAKGYTSFEDLLTDSNGTKNLTFSEAARKKGFLKDDTEWDECLERVSHFSFPNQMRSLFATIIIQGFAPDIPALWQKYKTFMHPRDKENKMSDERKDKVALSHIRAILRHHGLTLGQCHLPELDDSQVEDEKNTDEELKEIEEEMKRVDGILTVEQRVVAEAVFHSLKNKDANQLHFLQASGGCGKTVVTNYIINRAIIEGRKVVVMASSGVTAILLRNGRTVHSTFGVPLNLVTREEPQKDIMSNVGKFLNGTELIIWDEAPMQNKYVMYYVHDTMRNIVPVDRRDLPFGGVTVLLSGDWKQTLCVVKGVKREAILPYTLKGASDLWPLFRIHRLTKNLRVNNEEMEFKEWLETVGSGTANKYEDNQMIEIPEKLLGTKAETIEHVFPQEVLDNPLEMTGRMLLSMRNDQVLDLNASLMERFAGEMVEMIGITEHELSGDNEAPLDTLEDLQGLTPPGMPLHILKLKKGAPVVLLRNLNIVAGLCNGTRMVVEEFVRNKAGKVIVIMCRNISDTSKNAHIHAIPRIKCAYESSTEGRKFLRTQFPIWPAFAMTVNKAQGQTLTKVGLILESEPFSHGQTYVALSRVRSPSDLRIYSLREVDEDGKKKKEMKNIVYDNII